MLRNIILSGKLHLKKSARSWEKSFVIHARIYCVGPKVKRLSYIFATREIVSSLKRKENLTE